MSEQRLTEIALISNTADELAEDCDDEKRLEKAEKTAERNANRRKKSVDVRQRPYKRPTDSRHIPEVTSLPGQSVAIPAAASQFKRQVMVPRMTTYQREIGPCFVCSQMGHLRSHCPRQNAGNAKSWKSTKLWHYGQSSISFSAGFGNSNNLIQNNFKTKPAVIHQIN